MSRGGPGDGQRNDDGKYIVMFIAAVGLGLLVWYTLRPQFLWVTLGFDLVQLRVLDALGMLDDRGRRWMEWMSAVLSGRNSPADVTWNTFVQAQEEAGLRMRFLWIPACILLTVFVLFRMRGDGLRRNFSLTGQANKEVFRFVGMQVNNGLLKGLITVLTKMTFTHKSLVTKKKEWVNQSASFSMFQAKHWREALTGAMFNPDSGDVAMRPQLTPPQWMRENGVGLEAEKLDVEAARKAFEKQLGAPWSSKDSLDKAPTHVRAIMVMSALNVRRDKRLDALRAAVTEAYVLRPSKAAEEVEALIAPHLSDPKVRAAILKRANKHAFTSTATIAVYGWGGPMEAWGGKGGVLSTSLFLWLKRVDRSLWYALNNVGRRAFHIEGAGAISHYFMERVQGDAVSAPYMDSAVAGLNKYLQDHHIVSLKEYFHEDKDF